MDEFEKSQIRDNPFNQYWIIDLCCKTLNNHGDEYWNAYEVISEHHLKVNVCMDCDCIYLTDYECCIKWEKN